MSQSAAVASTLTEGVVPQGPSPSASENRARSSARSGPAASPPPPPKPRSCLTCRQRKVRCDKLSPCSNCRRADIACVFPSGEKPPRWARRLKQAAAAGAAASTVPTAKPAREDGPDAAVFMERLRTLEALVKQLSSAAAPSPAASGSGGSGGPGSPEKQPGSEGPEGGYSAASVKTDGSGSSGGAVAVQERFGRLILEDSTRSRYVSSGFWSHVNDEIEDLRAETMADGDSEDSEDEQKLASPHPQQQKSPADRHAFLFGHNLHAPLPGLAEFRPLPSQIPYLFQIYTESVNALVQIVHVPTVGKMIRDVLSHDYANISHSNEALLFAIYYAAVASMEDEDVMKAFGSPKSELTFKYRLGFEQAVAAADFLNTSDVVLVQAFIIFLFLVRRQESPRFVWMMTGLAIRMGQALGLQRDGANFKNLTPYDVEIRRRLWWALCVLDHRASEDQGTDLTIQLHMYDTKLPLNISDADISPETKETPPERLGITDMTFSRVTFEICALTRRMLTPSPNEPPPTLKQQAEMCDELYEKLDRLYLRHDPDTRSIVYWVGVTATRLVMAKMTLILYLPTLINPDAQASIDVDQEGNTLHAKLFNAAIEAAEYNHALNAEPTCRQWRWIFQTYTQWHAIAYLLIDTRRRLWDPSAERAWVALHSPFLIPGRRPGLNGDEDAGAASRSMRVLLPLRKLMAKVKQHRTQEIERLRADPRAARELEAADDQANARLSPLSSPGAAEALRDRWRKLVGLERMSAEVLPLVQPPSIVPSGFPQLKLPTISTPDQASYGSVAPQRTDSRSPMSHAGITTASDGSRGSPASTPRSMGTNATATSPQAQIHNPQQQQQVPPGAGMDGNGTQFSNYSPWLWADTDPSADVFGSVDLTGMEMDLDPDLVNLDGDGDIDWTNWFESVKDFEGGGGSGGGNMGGWQR